MKVGFGFHCGTQHCCRGDGELQAVTSAFHWDSISHLIFTLILQERRRICSLSLRIQPSRLNMEIITPQQYFLFSKLVAYF